MHPPDISIVLKLVEYAAKLFARLFYQPNTKLEDQILDYMAQDPDWHSASTVWGDIWLKTVLDGVPFSAAFPPTGLKGWARVKSRALTLRYEIRNVWRKWRYLVPKSKVADKMWDLWKRGLLERTWNREHYYRIKRD
jgi:hypothetical protein